MYKFNTTNKPGENVYMGTRPVDRLESIFLVPLWKKVYIGTEKKRDTGVRKEEKEVCIMNISTESHKNKQEKQ